MRRIVLLLVAGIVLGGFVFAAKPANAGLSFEDPQVCLNGKLLMVEPQTAPLDVFLAVGSNVSVDLNVADCGGDPNLPVVQLNHIGHFGDSNSAQILVVTKRHTEVTFHWDGTAYTRSSGNLPLIYVTFRPN